MFKSILSILIVFVVYSSAEIRNCDDKGVLFYEQFTGCKPVIKKGDECPSEFDCPEQKVVPGKCVFQGKEYSNREDFEDRGGCTMGCSCDADKGSNASSISCPEYDCPYDLDDLDDLVYEDCYEEHTLGDCCGGEKYCPKKTDAICNFGGETYRKGQAFYPSNTCYECVCQEGFKGELVEPFCKKVTCGLSYFNFKNLENKCAPFYIKSDETSESNLCCPFHYICGKDSRILNVTRSGVKSGQKCDFKSGYDMFAGDVFEVDYESNILTCTCHLPPYASCTGKYF